MFIIKLKLIDKDDTTETIETKYVYDKGGHPYWSNHEASLFSTETLAREYINNQKNRLLRDYFIKDISYIKI